MRVNRDSQYYLVDTSVSFNTQNVWNNLIWTLDPTGTGTWSVYVNGVQSTSAASTLYPNPIKRSMNYLGRSNWAADPYLNGGIKDFRMYSKVLSAAEVHTLFTSTQTIFFGATQCSSCPAGRFSSTSGSLSCNVCANGKTSFSGVSSCSSCPGSGLLYTGLTSCFSSGFW